MPSARQPARDDDMPPAPPRMIGVDTDTRMPRPCGSCGYDLRGLPRGARCPECGAASIADQHIDDPLSMMPRNVIRAFRRGCWMAVACILAIIALTCSQASWPVMQIATPALTVGIAVWWVISVFLLTPAFTLRQAAFRGFARTSRLRVAARWLQVAWPIAAAISLALDHVTAGTTGHALLDYTLWITLLAAAVAIAVLSAQMAGLAQWTRDDAAEQAFRITIWAVVIAVPFHLSLGRSSILIPGYQVTIPLGFGIFIPAATFGWGLASLASSVALSALHAREHLDREARRAERDERFARQIASRSAGTE